MKKIDSFINQYPLSKTLRFSLIPIGKTEENFNNALLLEKDKERAEKFERVKKYIDRYHKVFISEILSKVNIEEVGEYASLYFKSNKTEKEMKAMGTLEAKMRKKIAISFSKDSRYQSLFKKEMIKEILPSFLTSKDEIDDVSLFYGFTTYFTGFNENRKNIYSSEPKATAISYRCINENLPRFLDNVKKFEIIKESLPEEEINELNSMVYNSIGFYVKDIFCVDYYNCVLSQANIDKYNNIIGGYVDKNGVKIKGANEYINHFNQSVANRDRSRRLPLLTPLYKQILSDREAISFIPEKFSNSNELLRTVNEFCNDDLFDCLAEIGKLFDSINTYNFDGIFISSNGALNEISNAVFGRWDAILEGWRCEYKERIPMKKSNPEKYEDKMNKMLDRKVSFSLKEAQVYGQDFKTDKSLGNVSHYLKSTVLDSISTIKINYAEVQSLLSSYYDEAIEKRLNKNLKATEKLKRFLDSVKSLEHFMKSLKGSGKEENKDFSFYGEFAECYERLAKVDLLYDKVRNYMTQKPYSKDKIKLNFDKSDFLNGWAQSYERKGAMLFRDSDNYYIGIINKKYSEEDLKKLADNAETSNFERIVYDFQKPDNKNTPRLFIRSKGDTFAPAIEQLKLPINDIIEIYDGDYYRAEYRKKDEIKQKESLIKIIDYFKMGFSRHDSYKHYSFNWKNSDEYRDISEFYKDTMRSCYQLHFKKVNFDYVNTLINQGELYLFQIYNKDFSKYSRGNKNLHTMYFEMLFNERNLSDVVYQLNGKAEMFYREASIKEEEMVVHEANHPIKNKNADNPKVYSTFEYD